MTPQRGQIPVSAVFARARVLGKKKEKKMVDKDPKIRHPAKRHPYTE